MVQAFGREDDVQARFARKAEAVRDGVLRQARVEAAFLPGLLFLPTLSIGAVVFFGGHDVIGGITTAAVSASSGLTRESTTAAPTSIITLWIAWTTPQPMKYRTG